MAANTVPSGSERFLVHRGETLLTPGYNSELELRIPPTTEGPKRTEVATGKVWLTDERIVFIADKPNERTDDGLFPHRAADHPTLSSLFISYKVIRDIEFKVPLFSTNHLLIMFAPDDSYTTTNLPDPGHEAHIVARLVVGMGFGHNLYKRIEKEKHGWLQRQREGEPLPMYTPRPAGQEATPSYSA